MDDTGRWSYVTNDPLNRRIDGRTECRIASARPIAGRKTAIGTMANCAGGFTPWGTVLTCEEKVFHYYGDYEYDVKGGRTYKKSNYGWEKFHRNPPEHYGWVVEIDPLTGSGKKLTALGRMEHECATVRRGPDGRCVVYMGDDDFDQCIYKFVADKPGSLETGTLYVASLEKKRWLPLTVRENAELKKLFKNDTEVAIRARASAKIAGGTPLGRPEDIEIDPKTGAVYAALTVQCDADEKYGSIIKIDEKNNDPFATEFTWSKFISGGPQTGFACPDNLAFDRLGNLWMCNEVGGNFLNDGEYKIYGNNSLFYVPLSGPNAGRAFRVASGPVDAELTGPCFSPDGRTLFLSVQHPGSASKSMDQLTSHWPDGGDSVPRSSVVTISGPALDQLVSGQAVPPLFEVPVLKPA
jgi:secreted PhoX family phosphatase